MANILTRAPKWAWYMAGGVGIAGGAFQLMRHRREAVDAQAGAVDAGGGSGGAGSPVGLAPSPAPGIVVPPVIIPGQNNDPLAGVQPLQDLYIGAVSGVISEWQNVAHGWQDVYTPLIAQNRSLIDTISTSFLDTNSAMLALAQGGGAPPSGGIASPVVGQPAVAAAAPAPLPTCSGATGGQYPRGSFPNCYYEYVSQDCHCEGTGRNRKCWTRRLHHHKRSTQQDVVVSVDKVRDGC